MFSRFWHNGTCILPEIYRFWVQKVKLGQIRPAILTGLKKLEPKFEVSISKNEKMVQLYVFQKVLKIALSTLIYTVKFDPFCADN